MPADVDELSAQTITVIKHSPHELWLRIAKSRTPASVTVSSFMSSTSITGRSTRELTPTTSHHNSGAAAIRSHNQSVSPSAVQASAQPISAGASVSVPKAVAPVIPITGSAHDASAIVLSEASTGNSIIAPAIHINSESASDAAVIKASAATASIPPINHTAPASDHDKPIIPASATPATESPAISIPVTAASTESNEVTQVQSAMKHYLALSGSNIIGKIKIPLSCLLRSPNFCPTESDMDVATIVAKLVSDGKVCLACREPKSNDKEEDLLNCKKVGKHCKRWIHSKCNPDSWKEGGHSISTGGCVLCRAKCFVCKKTTNGSICHWCNGCGFHVHAKCRPKDVWRCLYCLAALP